MLHKTTHNRIRMIPTDPETGPVDRDDIVKGYEIEKDRYVVVTDEEIEGVRLESTRTIDIDRFVDEKDIDRLYWNDPYFLVPDGKMAVEAYTVIREAIARLKNEGLVTTRQGSGAFVRDWETGSLHLDPEISKNLESVLFIAELRKGIEAEAAALAAERRTRKDMVAIEKAYARVSETARARGDSTRADMGFHRAIADASHNPYYTAILDYLSQFLVQALRVSRGNEALREDFARQVESEHLDIVDAIRRKDSSAARLAAQLHMDQARIRIRKASRDIWSKQGKRLTEELIPPSLFATPPAKKRRKK